MMCNDGTGYCWMHIITIGVDPMNEWTKSMRTATGSVEKTVVALFMTVVSHQIISAHLRSLSTLSSASRETNDSLPKPRRCPFAGPPKLRGYSLALA